MRGLPSVDPGQSTDKRRDPSQSDVWKVVTTGKQTLLMNALVVSLCALMGTFIQFRLSASQRSQFERSTFRLIDDWRTEISWLSPIRRQEHRRVLNELLRENPNEARVHRRVLLLATSWTFLLVGAIAAVVASVINLPSS